MSAESAAIAVSLADSVRSHYSLWVSCHGYESRSVAHLEAVSAAAARRISFGFPFPDASGVSEASRRVTNARLRLTNAGYETPVVSDNEFRHTVNHAISHLPIAEVGRVVADISSMSRSRIAALLAALASRPWATFCELDLIYFPASFASHKHSYEPLEHFGPCIPELCGWPDDADMPLALVLGLGTEPRRADGVVEVLEPDILAVYVPSGDEPEYLSDVLSENRRLLEVCGEPTKYSIRDPQEVFESLCAIGNRLAERSRVVFVPLGPKLFSALSIAAALAIGPKVGVWKASAGKGVEPIDVQARGAPIVVKLVFTSLLGKAGAW